MSGRALDLGGLRPRALLALLTANVGRVLSVGALVEGLWGPEAPPDARRTARTYVSRLRRSLRLAAGEPGSCGPIVTHPAGYVLQLESDLLDAARFEQLAASGRQALAADQPRAASERLSAALELWRGQAYPEFGDIPVLHREAMRLDRLRLTTTADRIDAELALGAGEVLVGPLIELTERNPGYERLWGQLMTALYQAGRHGEALEAFLRARAMVVDQFGLEPSPALSEIHRRVLTHDPRLLGTHASGPRIAPTVRPAQLPPAPIGFTGRTTELAELDAVWSRTTQTGLTGVVICAICGMAGIGKTALVLHWAHRVAGRFPDGQLFVDLKGFDPSGTPAAPADALADLLDALGVPSQDVPVGVDARIALYRSLLAGRRTLIVLDNAANAEQIRPLLSGTPTSLVLTTSRDRLTGLIARDSAQRITVSLLPDSEASALLANRTGRHPATLDPDVTSAVIAGCGGLPLAIAIMAAQAITSSGFDPTTFATRLPDDHRGLDAFIVTGADRRTDLREVFSWSYRTLSPAAARLFRLLGTHTEAEIDITAAARLSNLPLDQTRRLLLELANAHLIIEQTSDWFTIHNLLHAYATELNRSIP